MALRKYEEPVELNKGIYWIGYYDSHDGLHCNPYLIVEGDEVVVIDSGSRTDFTTVMMKIIQTGIKPSNISALIYQHYDPDLCSSIPHFEALIDRNDLKIISHTENNIFIKYYGVVSRRINIEQINYEYRFKTGRKLKFIPLPYLHSPGSFATYDEETGTLFSSDLFGYYGSGFELIVRVKDQCHMCDDLDRCGRSCILKSLYDFHRRIMPCREALKYGINALRKYEISTLAPQHGSILNKKEDIDFVMDKIYNLDNVGIERYLKGD